MLRHSKLIQIPENPRVLIASRAGDPLQKAGRARLIWAANTADATSRIFSETWLACRGRAQTFPRSKVPLAEQWPDARFRSFYGVEGNFRLLPSPYPSWRKLGGSKMREWGNWEANVFFPREVLPYVDLLQTRDFRLAAQAVRLGVPTIYEDHNESFHRSIAEFPEEIVGSPYFLKAVVTTEAIRARMVDRGMPPEKSMVAWSGLNEGSLREDFSGRAKRIRTRFLGEGFEKLFVYAGGLQPCRGVKMILQLAQKHPESCFLILGGGDREVSALRTDLQMRRVENVRIVGYIPQSDVQSFLQAADVLLLPYEDPEEAKVTSPLKFFEYLAAGRPIVSARLPELESFARASELGVSWCEIANYECFEHAVLEVVEDSRMLGVSLGANQQMAARFTWRYRQKYIYHAAGISFSSVGDSVEQMNSWGWENPLASLRPEVPESV